MTEAADASITFTFDGTEFAFWNNYYGLKEYNSAGYGYQVVRVSDSEVVASGTNEFKSHAPSQVITGLDPDKYAVTITPTLATDSNSAVVPFKIGAIFFRDATKASVKGDIDTYTDGVERLSLTLLGETSCSVMHLRTPDSHDELLARCSAANVVSVSADQPVTAKFTARGRFA